MLALALLVVLDAMWMQLVAPLLGIKYVDIVESIQVCRQVLYSCQSLSLFYSLQLADCCRVLHSHGVGRASWPT